MKQIRQKSGAIVFKPTQEDLEFISLRNEINILKKEFQMIKEELKILKNKVEI